MSTIFFILMIICMVLTAASLAVGIGLSAKGGDANTKYGNLMMRCRVYLQGAALAFFALAFMTAGG